jgi:hypothetical protein
MDHTSLQHPYLFNYCSPISVKFSFRVKQSKKSSGLTTLTIHLIPLQLLH